MYYISKYNVFFEDYVFNLVSKNYLQLSEGLIDYLRANTQIDKNFPKNILSVLYEYNIVVDFNELQYIDFKYNSLKFDTRRSTLIIHPTLFCNFNCEYCFETMKKGRFGNKETKLLKNYIKYLTTELDEINIQWTGGEPLLLWKNVKDISSVLLTYKGVSTIGIATNGYLLTEKIVKEMKELNFSSIQITIDGSKNQHNEKRYTKTDNNTYDKILKAIEISSKYIITRIRFNVDKNNQNSFADFLVDLNKYQLNRENIEIYVKPIISKQGCSINSNLLNSIDFFNQEMRYLNLAKKHNYKYSIHPNYKSDIRCIYHHINSFAIDPRLNLYKCAGNIGVEKFIIGQIDKNSNLKLNIDYLQNKSLMYSPISINECRECRVLPICNGKCPLEWEKNKREEHAGCISEKKSIELKISQLIKYETITNTGTSNIS